MATEREHDPDGTGVERGPEETDGTGSWLFAPQSDEQAELSYLGESRPPESRTDERPPATPDRTEPGATTLERTPSPPRSTAMALE